MRCPRPNTWLPLRETEKGRVRTLGLVWDMQVPLAQYTLKKRQSRKQLTTEVH